MTLRWRARRSATHSSYAICSTDSLLPRAFFILLGRDWDLVAHLRRSGRGWFCGDKVDLGRRQRMPPRSSPRTVRLVDCRDLSVRWQIIVVDHVGTDLIDVGHPTSPGQDDVTSRVEVFVMLILTTGPP